MFYFIQADSISIEAPLSVSGAAVVPSPASLLIAAAFCWGLVDVTQLPVQVCWLFSYLPLPYACVCVLSLVITTTTARRRPHCLIHCCCWGKLKLLLCCWLSRSKFSLRLVSHYDLNKVEWLIRRTQQAIKRVLGCIPGSNSHWFALNQGKRLETAICQKAQCDLGKKSVSKTQRSYLVNYSAFCWITPRC